MSGSTRKQSWFESRFTDFNPSQFVLITHQERVRKCRVMCLKVCFQLIWWPVMLRTDPWKELWAGGLLPPCCTPASLQNPSPSSGRSPDDLVRAWTCCSERQLPEKLQRRQKVIVVSFRNIVWHLETVADLKSSRYLLTPEPSSCRSSAAFSASSHSFPVFPPSLWGPTK